MRTRTAGSADILAPWPAPRAGAYRPKVLHICWTQANSDSRLQETTCDQEFAVPRGPQQGGWRAAQHRESQTAQRAADLLHDAFVHRGIAHYPTFAHLRPAGLELRLHQRRAPGGGLEHRGEPGKHQLERDEREVSHRRAAALAAHRGREGARVDALVHDDAGVAALTRVPPAVAGVPRI